MIVGHVESLQARLPITLRLPNSPDISVEFVVDTGFAGELTLPITAVNALALPWVHDTFANLANDTDVAIAVHAGTILWQGEERRVRILATGKRPLLGMRLLNGQELVVQCINGGLATVDKI